MGEREPGRNPEVDPNRTESKPELAPARTAIDMFTELVGVLKNLTDPHPHSEF